jgi:hypothetical protein
MIVNSDEYLRQNLNERKLRILQRCILEHNKKEISQETELEALKFVNLVRDADKLDIYRVYLEYPELYPYEERDISDEVYVKMMANELISYSDMRNENDFRVLKLTWVFDLNFRLSYEIIQEHNYLFKVYQTLPQTEKIQKIYEKSNQKLIQELKCKQTGII